MHCNRLHRTRGVFSSTWGETMDQQNPVREPASAPTVLSVEHVILLVHGIRTEAAWAEMVANVLEEESGTKAQPIRFRFFSLLQFLSPILTRQAPIDRIIREYRDKRLKYPNAKISVIAHSFGTYVVTKALREPDLVFHKIIFCGSVAPDDFRVAKFGSQIKFDPILNDCGTRDILPALAKSITWGYGATGIFGFGTDGIRDRFHDYSHSEYFSEDFVRAYWLPYFRSGEIKPTRWEIKRGSPPYWQSLLAWIPLRYVLPICLAVTPALFYAERLPVPPSPLEGTWDVVLKCPDDAIMQEYNAVFDKGIYYRDFSGPPRSGWTKISLGREDHSVRLAGYLGFQDSMFDILLGKRDVYRVDGVAGKDGANYVGTGTIGTSRECSLTVTSKN
jgi:pimeloyl-ACP methyl ester carboxylesterase